MTHKEKEEVIWQAPEFKYQEKDISWYWLSIIGSAVLFLLSLWQKNFLFGLFVILAEIMVLFWAKQFPKILHFKINSEGIFLGKVKSYSFENLSGFHITDDADGTGRLIIKTKSKLDPFVKILVVGEDIPRIKEFLMKYLPEIEYEESLIDYLEKMIGF